MIHVLIENFVIQNPHKVRCTVGRAGRLKPKKLTLRIIIVGGFVAARACNVHGKPALSSRPAVGLAKLCDSLHTRIGLVFFSSCIAKYRGRVSHTYPLP